MGWTVNRKGTLTAKQIEFATKLADERAEAAAAPAPEVIEVTPVPEGRVTIEGEVIKIDWYENAYGETQKMLVKADEGWRVFGTVPAALDCERGDRVQFTATIETGDDPDFGFFKRPAKAALLAEAIA